ncbi:restriction endonuclease subunit S [Citrobacter amalonaticus]|uniref:restriction endonuclease subunit S n=1 Tax=Citrobacter portucalensis TaxID=1639133 RepID=UPI00226B3885|nr:restriction endonuclease subunit S [Citrobacter portucalensis]MCX9006329.1 restriction endonuclease subunit S [Citrobacter portucalensis]
MTVGKLISDHIDIWSSALQTRSTAGRGGNGKIDLYGIKKLRELILELAVRGKLVPQDPNDEPASELLKRIAAEKAELVKQGKIKKQKPLPEISEDEKPFELPEGWEWVRLGTLGYTQTGGTPSKSNAEYYGNDIPFIKPADITAQGVIYDNEGLSIKGAETLGRVAPSGSILMVCIGTIGKCQVINRTCSFNQQINSITPFSDISDFIYLDVSSSYFQSLAWDYSSSTTIAILNKGKWESLLVPIAPLSEQARIVTNVKKLMSLCDQLEQQSLTSLDAHQQLVETLLSTLTDSPNAEELAENWARISQHFDTLFNTEASIEALKQTILQLAVMGKLVPHFDGDTPVKETYETICRIKEKLIKEKVYQKSSVLKPKSSKLSIPDNWLHTQFGEVCCSIVPNRDKPKSFSGNIPWITLPSFDECNVYISEGRGEIGLSPEEIKAFNARIIPTGSVLMSCVGRFGLTMINKCEVVINQQIHAFIPLGGVVAEYLSFVIKASKKSLEESSTSTTIAYLNKSNCESIEFGLPPLEEQKRIVDKVNELIAMCNLVKSHMQSAQQTQLQLADALTDAALN